MKKFLKKIKGEVEPRPMKEIQQDYAKVCRDAADAGYQAFIYAEQQSLLHGRMKEINQEANRRNLLDQAAAAEAAKAKADAKS